MGQQLPVWMQEWLGVIVPLGQVLLIVLVAWLLRVIARRLGDRLWARYDAPPELVVGSRRVITFLISAAALLLVLQRLGVSGTVLWTAFTGFAAVAAVAFFAAWSVLSNVFCTMLILATRPFRLHDHIEILEGGDKPGLGGRVTDINLVYTTLQEVDDAGEPRGSVLRVPNSLFFQRSVRRWRSAEDRRRALRAAKGPESGLGV
ncbi:mechanosensitive ion channel family protein [Luteimonas sp. MC1750]|uniref:mechanosensitive ion channel family protein n=1 Tax=Luteimonas sp. MC1750 TaxID=2799326 RepID=UPI0018F081A0|nr:mechanosensitive ion channel family protein [Luteimonas sp. MC1750]MBJ6984439.1 mechanosensitive ion channel family protein [Luteimonas sp. MC1750]QQO04946.1 mechanosensitive ion channel family protein [Luteimonas sp. MC1750]